MNGVPHVTRQAPGKRAAIVLAIAVHVALIVFLVYGVRWQTKAGDVVQVDLVSNLPSPAPAPAASAPPPPAPAPKVEPKPEPKLEPRPEPKAPPPPKPDIVIKEKEKPKPKPEPKAPPLFDPTKLLTQDLAQASKLAAEQTDKQQAAQAAAAARTKAATSYESRIRSKIRGNIVLPPDIKGNPVAKFLVVQLPTGEIISHRLTKPSGNPAYDDAVERAILKSSPLPKPDDPSLFERQLELTFCPQESGCS